jgi:hypothetical protein
MIRQLSLPAIALFALLLPACNRNGQVSVESFQKLQPDQTEAQTVELLGPPTQTAEDKGERTLTWVNRSLKIIVRFRDGKLTHRQGTLDGLPLVAEVAQKRPADAHEADSAPADAEARYPTAELNTPAARYKDIHARCYACQTTVLTHGAEEGSGGFNQKDAPTDGSAMVGLVVHTDRHTALGEYVTGAQAIWLNGKGQYLRGKLLGTKGKDKTEIQAKRGYAVSSIQFIRDPDRYYGFSLTFMAIAGDKLDERSEYTSTHVGGKGPSLKAIDRYVTARDYPIYGWELHFGAASDLPDAKRWLNGIKIYSARGLDEK